jgi:lipopolysaccharide/colanic/teichoic acid biosynthesis glycosyltransferase
MSSPNAPISAGKEVPTTSPTPHPNHLQAIPRGQHPRWKRSLDLMCVLLTSPVWLPLMTLVAIAIKAVSNGPVFYRQRRVGLGATPFMMLKFRSMHVNADTHTHEGYFQHLIESDCPMTKLDTSGDPRLIRGGRLLRATALDELPQLFNVIRGDMSLVGPRPCTPIEFQRYEAKHMERFQFPPGLTGYWQVNGKNKTTFSEMIEMDIQYGRHMSVGLDLRIMLKTFPTLLEQVYDSQLKKLNARKNTLREQMAAVDINKIQTNKI